MSWKDLLQKPDETIVLPWLAREQRTLYGLTFRMWTIEGKLPPESGWWKWAIKGRTARWIEAADQEWPCDETDGRSQGYLVGDRFAVDVGRDINLMLNAVYELPKVNLIPMGLDRFEHIEVSAISARLFYKNVAMPRGPEAEVRDAFIDERGSIADIKDVVPGLDLAFRLESFQRAEAKRREAELARQRVEAEERRIAEERRQQLMKQLGSGEGRRELAKVDFVAAARAALAVAGAEYLDHRLIGRGQHEVRYRFGGERLCCVVDDRLHVIDSGICLIDHRNNIKGDTRFTLESLPAVVKEAQDDHKLVVFRR